MEHHYDKLLRPRSLISYYEELSRLSRSNDPEEQLLQKIRDGASEEVLESYLNITFQNISDGGDVEINGELATVSLEEQRNEGDKRCAKARALVYDKALAEAKDGTPIEEFLVKKLSTDQCLQRGGQCEMVSCTAVRWNMVNIVLALIRWRGAVEVGRFLQKEVLLTIAVQYGHVGLVKQLTKVQDVHINIDIPFQIFWTWGDIIKPNNIRLSGHIHEPYEYGLRSLDFGSTICLVDLKPIDCAAGMGNVQMVIALLACVRIDLNEGSPLHWAAAMGHLDVVKELLNSKKPVDVNVLRQIPLGLKYDTRKYKYFCFSPLHLASLFGHESVVKFLSEDTEGRLRANTESWEGKTALQLAMENGHAEIVKTLLERPEVAKQVEGLYRDRQVHVDAANAILVGAALIASVTFAAWLQPPLGYSAFFGSASIEVGAPSPSCKYFGFSTPCLSSLPLQPSWWERVLLVPQNAAYSLEKWCGLCGLHFL
jgi:hypothetical protein